MTRYGQPFGPNFTFLGVPMAIRMRDYLEHDASRPSLALRTDGLVDLGVVDAGDVEMYSGDSSTPSRSLRPR
jgi:agmatinase